MWSHTPGWKMASVGLRLTVENWVFLPFLLDTSMNHTLHWALFFPFHRSQRYKEGWLSLLRLGPRLHLVKCLLPIHVCQGRGCPSAYPF